MSGGGKVHLQGVSGRAGRARIVGMLAVLVAAVALLAGCGGSSKKSTSSAAPATTSSSTTSSSTTAASTTTSASTTSASTTTSPSSSSSTAAAAWTEPNGNLAGTRNVASSINGSNVNQLKVAWKVPLTGKIGIGFGEFAATPIVVNGVAYFQDLSSNVYAVKLSTGKLLWRTKDNSPNVGPDGVSVAG